MKYAVRTTKKNAIEVLAVKEVTRSSIARMVVACSVLVIYFGAVVSFVTGEFTSLQAASAAVAAPLALILKYYFLK